MSLDVYLYGPVRQVECVCDCGHEHLRNERDELFSRNITHNLNDMAAEAGVYKHLWRPDEIGVTKARDLIGPLERGLTLLRSDRTRFEAFNPKNGWGDYDGLLAFVAAYLDACINHPDAEIYVSR